MSPARQIMLQQALQTSLQNTHFIAMTYYSSVNIESKFSDLVRLDHRNKRSVNTYVVLHGFRTNIDNQGESVVIALWRYHIPYMYQDDNKT